MAIIISKNGVDAKKIEKQDFERESHLQEYIKSNPESIPIYEIQEDKRLFVVEREFSTESGPIDALAIDKDGDIYIVETKLYKNSDKRTVVAQALDYGASLWKHVSDTSDFVNRLDETVRSEFNVSLVDKLKEFFALDDEEANNVIVGIKQNLHDGNLKFVILMNRMDEQLKDLIIYINQNSNFDIYAVEMEYYKHEQFEIMIPRIFGVEVKKNTGGGGTSSARGKWDATKFFDETKAILSATDAESISRLYAFSSERADEIHWGTGVNHGSFSARFADLGNRPLFVIHSDGKMKISTEYPKRGANDEQVKNLDQLNLSLKNIGLAVDPKSERTVFTIGEWSPKLDELLNVFTKLISN